MRATRLVLIVGPAWLQLTMLVSAIARAPLADAVESREVDTVLALIDRKANVNVRQADGMTALHWAVHYDDTAMVKSLIAAGADAKATNHYGITPLTLACRNGNKEVVEMLLDAGSDANCACPGGETALMTAS